MYYSSGATESFRFLPGLISTPIRVPRRLVSGGTIAFDEPTPAPVDASSQRVEGQLDTESWVLVRSVAFMSFDGMWLWAGSLAGPMADEGEALEQQLCEVLGQIGDALYLAHNREENLWEAYVVAREHTDELYQAVVEAEERLISVFGSIKMAVRVRAHQGGSPSTTVPPNARRLLPR